MAQNSSRAELLARLEEQSRTTHDHEQARVQEPWLPYTSLIPGADAVPVDEDGQPIPQPDQPEVGSMYDEGLESLESEPDFSSDTAESLDASPIEPSPSPRAVGRASVVTPESLAERQDEWGGA